MNILHLNTHSDSFNLSFPHIQFHQELIDNGHNSVIFSARGTTKVNKIKILNGGSFMPFFGISQAIRKVFFELLNSKYYFYPEWNLDFITSKQIIKKTPFKPDVIFTYWTKFAFNQKLVYKLSKYYNIPVINVMMDMAPFTGGCHYAYDCTNYYNSCGKCPAINSNKKKDLSNITWRFKKKYIGKTNLSIIGCTSTISNQAINSSLFKNVIIDKLLLPINEKIFIPNCKLKARDFFNIPKDKKVIFFGAASLKEERKGIKYFIKSLDLLCQYDKVKYRNEDILLLIAGRNMSHIQLPFQYKYVGYLSTQEDLAKAYQACDLFACPSIEDSGPLMINQAIISGRPVVSFEMGVAPDLVFNGKTGYIAKLKSVEDFAFGLNEILELDNEKWNEMSSHCRELGLKECAYETHYAKLLSIIESRI